MKLTLARRIFTTQSTIGELAVDGNFECFTLEDPVRPKKIRSVTAIPAGTYTVAITFSPRFGTELPLLLDVPEFEGIRIHPGNTATDTEGCLLVGKSRAIDTIGSSRDAFRALFDKIALAQGGGETVMMEIVDQGVSPFMVSDDGDVEVTSTDGARFRVVADPLRLRSTPDTASLSNVVERLPFGHVVTQSGASSVPGWVRIKTQLDGEGLEGYVAKAFLEAMPAGAELFRVTSETLNLRQEAGKMNDAAIIAELPQGSLVAKVGISKKPRWWEVEATVGGRTLRGFVHSGFLEPDHGPQPVPSEPSGNEIARFRVTGDSLRLRLSPDATSLANVVERLPFGHFVTQIAGTEAPGWTPIKTRLDGENLTGFLATKYLEPVPAEAELFRVKSATLNLRTRAADLDDDAIIAELPRGLIVARIGASKKRFWWEVEAVLDGKNLRGFVHSGLLEPDSGPEPIPVEAPLPPPSPQGKIQVSERALQLILEFEGFDQPKAWPGGGSGVTLGIGYDLGFYTRDEFFSDWGPHLPAEVMSRLAKALGKTGASARYLAPSFSDIKIPRQAGEAVFVARTVPKHAGLTARAFPGVTRLPLDGQGALVSLVFNRGTSMEGDRRREMREIRAAIARADLPVSKVLESIANSLESMVRLWIGKGLDGLITRRKSEAALVRSCI